MWSKIMSENVARNGSNGMSKMCQPMCLDSVSACSSTPSRMLPRSNPRDIFTCHHNTLHCTPPLSARDSKCPPAQLFTEERRQHRYDLLHQVYRGPPTLSLLVQGGAGADKVRHVCDVHADAQQPAVQAIQRQGVVQVLGDVTTHQDNASRQGNKLTTRGCRAAVAVCCCCVGCLVSGSHPKTRVTGTVLHLGSWGVDAKDAVLAKVLALCDVRCSNPPLGRVWEARHHLCAHQR